MNTPKDRLTKENLKDVFCQPFDALANPFTINNWGNRFGDAFVDVVKMPEGPVTIDNTRPALAVELGIKSIRARFHTPDEPLPLTRRGRFGDPRTWGEAAAYRGAKQILRYCRPARKRDLG